MLDSLIDFFTTYGNFAVFGVLLLCGFGLPVPEDITLVAGGVIASMACTIDGSFLLALEKCPQVHTMFFVSMAGVLIGDSTMFFIGRIFGEKLLNVKFFSRLVTPERYEWVQRKFESHGFYFIFAARFMPGLRSPIFVISGMTNRVSYIKFVLTDGLAALISVPIWVYLGFWGERQLNDLSDLEHYIKRGQTGLLTVIGVLIVSVIAIWYVKQKIKEKTNFLK